MILASAVIVVLLSSQSPSTCESVEVCRAHALIAHAKGDFEAFHDFAWAASRKGKPNDPEAMLLIARAQSLSGRPGDALVMLERVASAGTLPSDLAADPEFARVRALPRWQEVGDALLAKATGAPAAPTAAPGAPTDAAKADPASVEAAKPAATPPPAKPVSPKADPAKPEPAKPEPAKVEPTSESKPVSPKPAPKVDPPGAPKAPPAAKPTPPAAEPPRPDAAAVVPPKASEPSSGPPRPPGVPLKFTTPLTPTALAYDRVSKRYIIADRRARRIAVIDENTGQVSTLAGAMAGLTDVEGIAIDAAQGDLWVVTSADDGPSLSRMQLISGRVLSTAPLQDISSAIVALTFVPGAGLIVADSDGVLWTVRTTGRASRLTSLEYVPKALGADARGRLYVSAGGPRLARYAVSPLRRLGTVDLATGSAPDGPFIVTADHLQSIAATPDGYEVRSSAIK